MNQSVAEVKAFIKTLQHQREKISMYMQWAEQNRASAPSAFGFVSRMAERVLDQIHSNIEWCREYVSGDVTFANYGEFYAWMKRLQELPESPSDHVDMDQLCDQFRDLSGLYLIPATDKPVPIMSRQTPTRTVPQDIVKRRSKVVRLWNKGLSLDDIAEQMHITRQTVRQDLERQGVSIPTREELANQMYQDGKEPREIAQSLSVSIPTVRKYLGISPNEDRPSKTELSQERRKMAAKLYKDGRSLEEIADALNVQTQTVRLYLKRELGEYSTYKPSKKERISAMHKDGATIEQIVEAFGISEKTVRNHLGIKKPVDETSREQKRAATLEMLRAGKSIVDIANELHVNPATIKQLYLDRDSLMDVVKFLYDNGANPSDIAKQLSTRQSLIHSYLSLPDVHKATIREKRLADIQELLSQDMAPDEIAQNLGILVSTVYKYLGMENPHSRRKRVMAMYRAGASNADIAHQFGISEKTVSLYLSSIMKQQNHEKKLDLINQAKKLYRAGLNRTQIATEMGKSLGTIRKYLHGVKRRSRGAGKRGKSNR